MYFMTPPESPSKAKSRLKTFKKAAPRLKRETTPEVIEEKPAKLKDHVGSSIERHTSHHHHPQATQLPVFFKKRLKFLPLLFLAILAAGACFHLVTRVQPSSIANILYFHSYLPFQLSFFFSSFFLASFLLLNTRRAFFISCFFGILLFLKLQSVVITPSVFIIPLLFFCTIEGMFSFIFRK